MATLVLTAVGAAVGGPIGAVIGRSVDTRIFRPATREGPRLTDLALQTSSYGTQIPKLFGTIRVAGTVIWATDLIETRTTVGGSKGQPSTATYSYSASFAVVLSARAIRGVRRIWAEGKLLRGAAGDWKATTGFRLYLGDEDQPVDPLIASAEPTTPAYRGCAYAVFEALHLGDFGNRIPSLTFEVVADEGAVAAGAIAMALADEVDAEVAQQLEGYAAAGDSVAGVLDSLAVISGAWWSPGGARLTMRDAAGDPVMLADDAVVATGAGQRRARAIAAIDTVPRTLSVAHHDPARDYQIGVQQAVRPGAGTQAARIELPAVLTASAARGIAERALVIAEAMRIRRTVSAGIDAIGLVPGSAVAIIDEQGIWRARSVMVEGMATRVELAPVTIAPITGAASSGQVLGAPDRLIGATMLRAFDIPPLGDDVLGAPRLSVVATGTEPGWRGAALLYSLDDGESWIAAGATAAPATLGVVELPPGDGPATLADRRNVLIAVLARADMMLGDADDIGLSQGRNLALVGDELIQFARATPLGDARWRLSGLRRGVRGTDWASAAHQAGEAFTLIEREAVGTIDLPLGSIGQGVALLATGVGDVAGPAAATAAVSGGSVVPPSPVHLHAAVLKGGGWQLSWTRRSRQGWAWADLVDAPLVEETERYAVTILAPDGAVSNWEVTAPSIELPTAPEPGARVEIRQRGTHGTSHAAVIMI
ncbi:phage tail protein [Sphingomonas oligophenolica]|uniref:Uncharacterized protein n=1 Tax=Sphingomonas oligophenolica TaxID=301154 RepID=A0A502CP11_9SPHN|nr:phage tail protein [Sphingomonas oligophenolica]TPG15385.1 hypothetical protein EAH84_00820 [Sphingomonas oligophenolica]